MIGTIRSLSTVLNVDAAFVQTHTSFGAAHVPSLLALTDHAVSDTRSVTCPIINTTIDIPVQLYNPRQQQFARK